MATGRYRFVGARFCLIAGSAVLLAIGTGSPVADTLYKCVDGNGRVAYQQRPCDSGAGTQITTKSASPRPADTQSVSVPIPTAAGTSAVAPAAPAVPAVAAPSKPALPATPPAEARGRLDGYPASGYGLAVGMSGNDVIRRWGRPHEINVIEPDSVFFHYCDLRTAFIYKGELVSWSARFPDSESGATLYKFGEPWIRAVQKWGYERAHKSYSNSGSDRGDIEQWTPNRWVVTDAQGNIVSWCDAADYRSPVTPPQKRTAWE